MIELLAQFHPPTTKDFVWGCWGPSLRIGGLSFCLNFITLLVLMGLLLCIAFFFFSLRRTSVVPGKFQSLAELGTRLALPPAVRKGPRRHALNLGPRFGRQT